MQHNGTRVFHAIRELCTGCLMCEQMCAMHKAGRLNPSLARLRISRQHGDYAWVPIICRHCRVPACLEACPVPEAMTMDEALGVVAINEAACTGCLACVEACPFGAIQVGPNKEVLKCDLCQGDPACVRYCPPRPENSLPHLPWPKQSCLQYVAPQQVNLHKFIATMRRGMGMQLPDANLEKRHGLAPQDVRSASRHDKA